MNVNAERTYAYYSVHLNVHLFACMLLEIRIAAWKAQQLGKYELIINSMVSLKERVRGVYI